MSVINWRLANEFWSCCSVLVDSDPSCLLKMCVSSTFMYRTAISRLAISYPMWIASVDLPTAGRPNIFTIRTNELAENKMLVMLFTSSSLPTNGPGRCGRSFGDMFSAFCLYKGFPSLV